MYVSLHCLSYNDSVGFAIMASALLGGGGGGGGRGITKVILGTKCMWDESRLYY